MTAGAGTNVGWKGASGVPPEAGRAKNEFVVADPHVVYFDAVMHSPWDHDGGGRLPDRGDWSTYRYTVKDIILGIATHRYNKNNRRLEIRAYFVGEHPLFKELEPTKAMMVVFCCQAFQSGGSLSLHFEHGIPLDVRELVEREMGVVIGGHEHDITNDAASHLFAALSQFSPAQREQIEAQRVDIRTVCFNTFRGVWAPNHIKSLLQRGIPLSWLFARRLSPLAHPTLYAHLIAHLKAVLLEEYAVRRLEDRQMGETITKRITRNDDGGSPYYRCEDELRFADGESDVSLPPQAPFVLVPLHPRTVPVEDAALDRRLEAVRNTAPGITPLVVSPMDFAYLPERARTRYASAVRRAGAQLLVIGLTVAQLLAEVEFGLAMTASQADEDAVDMINVDRYPD